MPVPHADEHLQTRPSRRQPSFQASRLPPCQVGDGRDAAETLVVMGDFLDALGTDAAASQHIGEKRAHVGRTQRSAERDQENAVKRRDHTGIIPESRIQNLEFRIPHASTAWRLAARLGELLHRLRQRDGVPAAAAVPDAGARCGRHVARRHRRRRRSGEQRPQDCRRPHVGPVEPAQAARRVRLHALLDRPAAHVGGRRVGPGARPAVRRSARKGHPRRAPGRDARPTRERREPGPRVRLSPRNGSRGSGRGPDCRRALPLLLSWRVPDTLRAHGHTRDHRHRARGDASTGRDWGQRRWRRQRRNNGGTE